MEFLRHFFKPVQTERITDQRLQEVQLAFLRDFAEGGDHQLNILTLQILQDAGYTEREIKTAAEQLFGDQLRQGHLALPVMLKAAFPDLSASPKIVQEARQSIIGHEGEREGVVALLVSKFTPRDLFIRRKESLELTNYFIQHPEAEETYERQLKSDKIELSEFMETGLPPKDVRESLPEDVSRRATEEYVGYMWDIAIPPEAGQRGLGYFTKEQGLEILRELTDIDFQTQ